MRIFTLGMVVFLFICMEGNAQGTIKGKIIDSAAKSPLGLATVTIFKAADTTLITYRLSTPDGEFKVTGLPLGLNCRAVISFSGYEVYRHEFTLLNDTHLDLGIIKMAPASKDLDEVLVVSERPPVTVRKDTIEFNAASFKTLPTALVEDMLKKLPGVQVDGDGNITVNGKKVNRIMVDGKEFFGSDPKMATRNLPANIIDKIQVAEDKDERELNPDRSNGDIGQVINLKLKKAIKQGWFGKAYAGGGTDKRYEGGAIVNLFRDTMQVSLLGFSNNINRAGFGLNDIRTLGGFERSGINNLSIYNGGGINVNGISFGGTGEGINQSTGSGFNMNHVLKNGVTLNTQYFYGQTKNDIAELNNRQQFLGDTILVTRSNRDEVLKTFTHRVGVGVKGKIDSLTRFEFRPSVVLSDQASKRFTGTTSNDNYKGLLNTGNNEQKTEANDLGYTHSFLLFKNFRKKGRTLNVTHSVNYGNNENNQVNEALNTFYGNGLATETSISQLRDRDQQNLTATLNTNFNEPLTKRWSVRLGYIVTYFNNNDVVATFNKGNGSSKYDIPNMALTNGLARESWRNSLSPGLNWKYKKWTVTGTANLLLLNIENNFSKTNEKVNQHYKYILPGITINWKEINFNYSANVTPPGIADIQPTPDNSNPLFIMQGNPALKPVTAHTLNLNYFKNITAKTLFVNVYMYGNFRDNAITRSRAVLPNGVQVATPVNVDGNQELYNFFNINKQRKFNKDFQISFGGGYNFNYNRNYLIVNNRKSYVTITDIGPRTSGSLNWKDMIEWNYSFYMGFNRAFYQSNAFTDLKTNRSDLNTELVIRWPKRIVWETSLNRRYNPVTAAGVQRSISLLNAGVTFLFLKDNKGQVKFSGFDLLNENVSVFRLANENLITDRQLTILQRYFIATFTYNLRTFKGGKVGGRERFFMF